MGDEMVKTKKKKKEEKKKKKKKQGDMYAGDYRRHRPHPPV